jgi:tRNA A-37 threonylcarbamoyl transferase component Bud32
MVAIAECEPLEQIKCPACSAEMEVHSMVGQYRLLSVAGRGGMGVVYKAYDASLDRQVALKLLRKDHSNNATLIQQLATEASITAAVNHPNVVKVYSTGTDRGRFFLAMELVDKGSLDDLIRLQGRIAEKQALEIGIHIAKGLKAAHQHGLIHRDVKPGNILFADAHTAKIVDFGLAIFMDQEESVRGEVWGTPYYIAPEKLDGQPEDFRSDIYSLGGTLFHAISGRPPFEAETASLVALKHLKNQPVSIATYAPWVSGATAYVINRTLVKNPAERYQSYDELIEHFEYALEELLKAGEQPPTHSRVVLESVEDRQRWGWVVVAMLAVCLLLVGGVVFRKQIFGGATADGQAARSPENATNFAFTRELQILANGEGGAAEAFRRASTRENLTSTDRAWAALLEGVAELDAGRPTEARVAFQNLQALATKIGDPRLTMFFIGTAARMGGNSAVSIQDAQELDRNSYQAIALLLYGLKDWQEGKTEESASLLREFSSAAPTGSASWISGLQTLATKHLKQLAALGTPVVKTSPRPITLIPRTEENSGVVSESQPVPLSDGWSRVDVGQQLMSTRAKFDPGPGAFTMEITNGDLWGSGDSVNFVYRKVKGDFEIVAHLSRLTTGNKNSKACVVIRESLESEAASIAVSMNLERGINVWQRATRAATTRFSPSVAVRLKEGWLKLVREGQTVTAFHSEDGQQWTRISVKKQEAILPPLEVFAGLCLSAGKQDTEAAATFDHVEVIQR